jgi:DNA repair protein SbcD/Mre11
MKPIGVLLTDTHSKEDNQELVFDIFLQAVKLCKKLKVKKIFHAGDFFTSRASQSLQVLILLSEILDLLTKENIEMIGIAGNHDKTNQDSENSYLDIYKNYKCFKVVRSEECIDFNGITIGFLPFFSNSYKDRLKKIKGIAKDLGNDTNILITHHAFNGAVNNDGTVVDESIPPKSVRFWDKVLVGHYHDSNHFDNVYYVGSAYQGNFGERIDDKGFTIIYDNGEIDFEPSVFKKFIKVKLDINDNVENEIEMYSGNGDNVRFIFSGDQTDLHKIDRQKLDDLGIDVKFELNDVNEEILKVEQGDFASMSKKNILNYFKEYCEIQDIEKGKISKGLKHLLK